MRRAGITLVELIVVLAIIVILIGIFLPAVGRVREAARETVCKNKLRQINLAMVQIAELVGVPKTNPRDMVGGWAIDVLPFMEAANVRSSISVGVPLQQLDEDFYDRPNVFECPTQLYKRKDESGQVASGHYLLLGLPSNEKREFYVVTEAPLTIDAPWATSPEMHPSAFDASVQNKEGPHHGGFYRVDGMMRGVDFTSAN